MRHRGPQHPVVARGALDELVVRGERQRDHDEEAAGRAVPADVAGREAPAKAVEEAPEVPQVDVRLPLVRRRHAHAVPQQLPADHRLRDRRRVDGHHALDLGQFVREQAYAAVGGDHPLVGHGIADSGAREASLRERPQVDHLAAGVERLERGLVRPLVEQAVRVVLQQQHVLARRQGEQVLPKLDGQAHPGRVREVGHHVARPRAQPRRPGPAGRGGEVGQVDPVRTASYRPDGHVDQPRGPGDADVGGRDGEQDVPLVAAQCPQGDEHRLLAADGDHDRLRVGRHALVARQLSRDKLVDDSLGPAVLKDELIHLRIVTSLFCSQITRESFDVVVYQRRVKKSFEGTAGGERNRLRMTASHLVEKIHGLQGGLGQ